MNIRSKDQAEEQLIHYILENDFENFQKNHDKYSDVYLHGDNHCYYRISFLLALLCNENSARAKDACIYFISCKIDFKAHVEFNPLRLVVFLQRNEFLAFMLGELTRNLNPLNLVQELKVCIELAKQFSPLYIGILQIKMETAMRSLESSLVEHASDQQDSELKAIEQKFYGTNNTSLNKQLFFVRDVNPKNKVINEGEVALDKSELSKFAETINALEDRIRQHAFSPFATTDETSTDITSTVIAKPTR